MFQDTLLESSATSRRRKRWPMATAFLLELTVGAALVAVPLFTTGAIPVFVHKTESPRITDIDVVPKPKPTQGGTGPSRGPSRPEIVPVSTCTSCIHIGRPSQPTDPDVQPTLDPVGTRGPGPDVPTGNGEYARPTGPERGSFHISNPSEAQLVKRVEPIYPRLAQVTGISGIVRLHAIIAKDGSIQSLSVISGHPQLAPAALEAVQQWRYRPYLLNGEAVDVELLITVNFRRER